jgi:hypothetical protein
MDILSVRLQAAGPLTATLESDSGTAKAMPDVRVLAANAEFLNQRVMAVRIGLL